MNQHFALGLRLLLAMSFVFLPTLSVQARSENRRDAIQDLRSTYRSIARREGPQATFDMRGVDIRFERMAVPGTGYFFPANELCRIGNTHVETIDQGYRGEVTHPGQLTFKATFFRSSRKYRYEDFIEDQLYYLPECSELNDFHRAGGEFTGGGESPVILQDI